MTLVKRQAKPMNRYVTVHIGEFSVIALGGGGAGDGSERVEVRLARALVLYLHDKDSAKLGWECPRDLPAKDGQRIELELAVDAELWDEFEQEARRQDVTVSELAAHAALYYAAEVDAGRITQRILAQLQDEETGGGVE